MPFIKTCRKCGKEFITPEKVGVYCSRKCVGDSQRGKPVRTLQQALFDKIRKTDGCWIWTGYRDRLGYGVSYATTYGDGKAVYAHRLAFHTLVGPIPQGLELDHLCRNPSCVNPEHLEPVTHAENIRRGLALLTSCPHGHPYTPENTKFYSGGRTCRECNRLRSTKNYAERRKRRHREQRVPSP